MNNLTQNPDLAITTLPCHGRKLRYSKTIAATRALRCPEEGCSNSFFVRPDGSLEPLMMLDRSPITPPPQPPMRAVPMRKTDFGEMRLRCAVTGARWVAVFEKNNNSGKFIFKSARAGSESALEMMMQRLLGNPRFKVEPPREIQFKWNDLVWGTVKCPCCEVETVRRSPFITCNDCNSYVCRGTVREVSPGVFTTRCHPQCRTHDQEMILTAGNGEPLNGYTMRVYQQNDGGEDDDDC